jgi:uncharacterized membrane protein HdeD (DUF308 family)
MEKEHRDDVMSAVTAGWQLGLFVGLVTLVLGLIVAFHPTSSLNVIAVILGIIFLIGGVFRLIRTLDSSESHRVWGVILGILFVVVGVLLIRHLDATRVLIALIIGLVWIIQGIVDLMAGFSGEAREGKGWAIFVGLVSLAAGIVVIAVPEHSITVLAVLLGIWFIVLGLLQVVGAFLLRRAQKKALAS